MPARSSRAAARRVAGASGTGRRGYAPALGRAVAVGLTAILPLCAAGCARKDGSMDADVITIHVDPTQRYQEIEGFGASGSWTIDPIGNGWDADARAELGELLFSTERGIGLSIWKFNAGADGPTQDAAFFESPYRWRKADSFRPHESEPYDWTAHEGQQVFLREAVAHGVPSIQVIFYSPPRWMTKNGLTQPMRAEAHTSATTATTTSQATSPTSPST